jgi:hypothetical protein
MTKAKTPEANTSQATESTLEYVPTSLLCGHNLLLIACRVLCHQSIWNSSMCTNMALRRFSNHFASALLLTLPNYVKPLLPSPTVSTWRPGKARNQFELHQLDGADDAATYTITGVIDVNESILKTTGNWNDRFNLKNAKLNIALGRPANPILLKAFDQSIDSIQKLEEKALSAFPKSTQAKPAYSLRQNNMNTKKLLHLRHKLFTQVNRTIVYACHRNLNNASLA